MEIIVDRLTKLEGKILSSISKYFKKYNEFPTIDELCNLNNMSSVGTMHRYLKSLESKGFINKLDNGWRGRELTIKGESYV